MHQMRITIVYDNRALPGFKAAWGFSCLIEHGMNILFDTGGNAKILRHNMEKLGISLDTIDAIFISHAHRDHAGGLKGLPFRGAVFVPPSSKLEGVKIEKGEFLPDFIATGERYGERSLVVRDGNEVVVITGCAHNGLEYVLHTAAEYGSIKAVIGGFHDFRDIAMLRHYPLVVPCHCTVRKREIERFENAQPCRAGGVIHL
ncbi:MAG TPA: MBL fold metallo-hydrolase [Thermoplasmatales archaeon]|nr:MAG: MBL fold metallo-hydrolase [Thermoplasmata archaeon]HDN50368.1 MBL fold metallo-hydrolase [Thermoplasmatales archaeon]